jgi:RimJ/RimL family protein N-acetyltransferase
MEIEVFFSDDASKVLNKANLFLSSEPVHHNLILTLLHSRVAEYEPGRYWVATNSNGAVGVVVQSPLNSRAIVTPMKSEIVSTVVDAISDANIALPGVAGDAATAACFAGEWAERHKSPVFPFLGLRLYEVAEVQESSDAIGHFRPAILNDRELLIDWISRFSVDIGEHGSTSDDEELKKRKITAAQTVDSYLSDGHLWLWENTEPVSMVARTTAVAGVVQVRHVYTPREHRNRGYATACVSKISKQIRDEGNCCILYNDLCNPISNTIYRRIGYRAVAEAIQYRFE